MRAYKYVWKEFTVVRLSEKSFIGTKVSEWQTIQSDRDPKYFLTAGFVEVDVPTVKVLDIKDKQPEWKKAPAKAKSKAKPKKKASWFEKTMKKK